MDTEDEAPIFWSSDTKIWLIGTVLMLGKNNGRRRRGCQRMRWLNDITDAVNMNLGRLWEILRDRDAWHASVHGVTKSHT